MHRKDAIAWVVSVCSVSLRLSQAKTLSILVAAAMRVQRISLANIGRMMEGTVKHQVDQMRYAGIQAAIASWWGPGSSTDKAFATDLRAADGTPFRWAIYYELEGPGYPNQSPDQLHASMQYIADRYANDPNYLHVGGRPVVFVWPDGDLTKPPQCHGARVEEVRSGHSEEPLAPHEPPAGGGTAMRTLTKDGLSLPRSRCCH